MADDEMVVWLSATLDELAFEAEEAADAGGYEWDSFAAEQGYGAYVRVHGKSLTQGKIVEASGTLAVVHIALHDPRAVLARVQAERSVLALHSDQHECSGAVGSADWPPSPCDTLRLLAYGHRFDAPNYRDEWSPDV